MLLGIYIGGAIASFTIALVESGGDEVFEAVGFAAVWPVSLAIAVGRTIFGR